MKTLPMNGSPEYTAFNQQGNVKLGRNVGYRRVSTSDKGQTTEHQLGSVELDLVFEDELSGKSTVGRVGLQECMDTLKKGDTLYVQSADRLARNVEDTCRIVRELSAKGVTLRLVTEGLTFYGKDGANDLMAEMTLKMLSMFAELFSKLHGASVKRGMAYSKKTKGTKFGSAREGYSSKHLQKTREKTRANALAHAEKYRSQVELMVSMKMTLRDMADKLTEMGCKTMQGNTYTANSVSNLCKYLKVVR